MTKLLYVLCEGESEKVFVDSLLTPYLTSKFDICVETIILDGTTSYPSLVQKTKRIVSELHNFVVTSMVDFYGLKDKPALHSSLPERMASELEEHYLNDVGYENFVPYISMHEYEAIYFSDPHVFSFYSASDVKEAEKILGKFHGNPEAINGNESTAPSKRILGFEPNYIKMSHAEELLKRLSITSISDRCKHFSSWIATLKKRIEKMDG